jgi:hypothetical protein
VAALVKEALARRAPLRAVALAHGLADARTLDRLLAPRALTRPRTLDVGLRQRLQSSATSRAFGARHLP